MVRCLFTSSGSQGSAGGQAPSPLNPCNLDSSESDRAGIAVTGGSSSSPGSLKTVGERRTPPVNPQNPNSRRGRRARSSFRQGRVEMDRVIVGIDVSKDRLDVVVRPSGETFTVERNAAGVEKLVARLCN